jgi:hypothetical protein
MEEQVIKATLVVQDQRIENVGNGEDDVEVRDRKESVHTCFEPVGPLTGLAFGTVAIAAGIVRDAGESARIAAIDVSAPAGGAAGGQTAQNLGLIYGQWMTLAVRRPLLAQDVSDFPGGTR